MQIIQTDAAPKAIGPYAQSVRTGDLLFCSGQIPLNPESMKIEAASIEDQTRQVFENVKAVLAASGLGLSRVVTATVFLKDMADFPAVNEIYAEYMGGHTPARSTIQVAALPLGAMVEIEVIATFTE